MTNFGYTLMTEQSGPKDLVRWAIEIIRELHAGGLVTYRGQHFDVDSAEGWDLPDTPVEIGVIVEGGQHPVRAAQQRFLAEAAEPLLGRLRAAAP
ncbi:MAG: hypothetical protein ABIQ53_08980 [Terracoccus sp.]